MASWVSIANCDDMQLHTVHGFAQKVNPYGNMIERDLSNSIELWIASEVAIRLSGDLSEFANVDAVHEREIRKAHVSAACSDMRQG
jgi:hypothetical protein